MPSLSDEGTKQCKELSKKNKPSWYEMEHSKPLDLPGEWDVSIFDIMYSHNWTNLENYYLYVFKKNDNMEFNFKPENQKD